MRNKRDLKNLLSCLDRKILGTVDFKLCKKFYDDSPPYTQFSSESYMWSNSRETRGATSMGSATKPRSHHGLLPVPHVLIDMAYVCVCFMKCMLEQEGIAFHVPIIYPLFQTNASEMFSWHTVGSPGLQAGPGPRFSSLFSARSAKTLHSPPAQKSLPPKLQSCLYRPHSTAIYTGASSWALTERLLFLPMSC